MIRTATLISALTLAACQQEAQAPAARPEPAIQPPVAGVPPPAPPATNTPAEPTPEPQASDDWRDYAKPADVERLKQLDAAWETALASARKAGHEKYLAELDGLADPKTRALANPHPAPGNYRCRTVKIGGLGVISYPWFRCRIELTPGGDLTYTKLTGSQRGEGKFYPSGESERRLVYLGGQAWGLDPTISATDYGDDPQRDQIGVLERIGDQRWRLALPLPRVESELDIIELAK